MAGDMSSLSQIEESTAGSSNEQKNEERQSAVVAFCLGCVLIGTLLGLLFFVVSNVISGGDGKGEGETGAPGVYAKGQPGGPAENFSPKTNPAPTTTPRTLPPFTLVCTVHFDATDSKWLSPPEDKTCDFIYYESLYQKMCQIYFYSKYAGIHFRQKDVFVKLASTVYVHTRIGISVDFMGWETFQKHFRSEKGKREIDEYNALRIRDWGFLNLHQMHFRDYPDQIKEAFITLKELAEYQASQNVESYMLLGVYLENETICDKTANLLNTIFTPHGIISLGHTSIGCSYNVSYHLVIRSLPANCDFDPEVEKPFDPERQGELLHVSQYLGQAVEAVKCLQNRGVDTMFAVSLTIAPLFYDECDVASSTVGNFFVRCGQPFNRQEIQKVCMTLPRYEEDDSFKSIYYDDGPEKMLVFENLKYLKKKACATWQGTKDLRLGVSIYDINYDYFWQNSPNSNESHVSCPKEKYWDGEWVRMSYLLKFRNFLENEATNRGSGFEFSDRCGNL